MGGPSSSMTHATINLFKKRIRLTHVRYESKEVTPRAPGEQRPNHRHTRLPHYDSEAPKNTTVILVGTGGIGSEIAMGAIRLGLRSIINVDPDCVDMTNLGTQNFTRDDLDRPKAERLCKHLFENSAYATVIEGYIMRFEEFAREYPKELKNVDFGFVSLDSDHARRSVAKIFYSYKIPAVITGVAANALSIYSFYQQPGKACFSCLFPPDENIDTKSPCVSPGGIFANKLAAGLALYIMYQVLFTQNKNLQCNYYQIFVAEGYCRTLNVKRSKECPACGGD